MVRAGVSFCCPQGQDTGDHGRSADKQRKTNESQEPTRPSLVAESLVNQGDNGVRSGDAGFRIAAGEFTLLSSSF